MQPDTTIPAIEQALAVVAQHDAASIVRPAEPIRTLADWLSDPSALEPPQMIVPQLALGGRVTLLAAREKAGKSTLLGQAVAAYSRGGEFLGEQCGPGRVLWYAIDEAAADAVRRLDGCGADGEAVAIQRARPTPQDFRVHIGEFRPDLVVIDTLTELMTGRVVSEKDAQDMQQGLRPYIDVLRETETAAVILHHQTKHGGQYRGSTQLGAMVDVLAELNIPSRGEDAEDEDPDVDPEVEARRVLHVRGRGLDTRRTRLFFDGTGYRLGEGEQGLTARIIRAVANGADSGNKVAVIVKGRRETVNATIDRLLAEQKLSREGGRLFAPMFGSGSVGGSRHAITTSSGTTSGTTLRYAGTESRSTREPHGNHSDIPRGHTGTTREPATLEVVPVSVSLERENGKHPPPPPTIPRGFGTAPAFDGPPLESYREEEGLQ